MSLLDDARRLSDAEEPTYYSDNPPQSVRVFCGRDFAESHAPDCPWLSLPRIVAALEAAERVVYGGTQWAEDDNGDFRVPADDLRALVAALKEPEA